MKPGRDLTEGSILKNLIMLAAPIVLGMFLQSAFNIIDTIFVGMLGAEDLAAVSLTFPVVFIFIALASGLSVGATIMVSKNIGRKNMRRAANAAEHALLLSAAVGIVIAVLGILFSEPIFVFMGAEGNVLSLTVEYSRLIFIGFAFLFVGFVGQGILQAEGDSKTPFKFNLIAVFLNIVLDPLLIFGLFGFPALGIAGAALATVIARSIGAALVIGFLYTGKAQTKIELSPRYFKFSPEIAKRIFRLGIPASFGNVINSLGMMIMMSLVAGFGSFAIAAYGVGLRIDSLAVMPVVGVMSALVAITGQNLGAGKPERVGKTLKVAIVGVSALMLAATAFMVIFPGLFFGIFTTEQGVITMGATYLSIVALGYVFRGIAMLLVAVFQGAGRTMLSAALMGLNWAVVIAAAFFMKNIFGLEGIWWSMVAGLVLFSAIGGAIYKTGAWMPRTDAKRFK